MEWKVRFRKKEKGSHEVDEYFRVVISFRQKNVVPPASAVKSNARWPQQMAQTHDPSFGRYPR